MTKIGMAAKRQSGMLARQRTMMPAADAPPDQAKGIKLPGGTVLTVAPNGHLRLEVPPPNGLQAVGGSDLHQFNQVLLDKTIAATHVSATAPDGAINRVAAVAAALAAFKPTDEIEGMIASQAVALHFGAMECFRRATLSEQHPEVASKLRKDGANMARAMTDMIEAIDRKRGKGPQVVRVERVVVQDGGQAIVGNLSPTQRKGGGA